MHTLVSSSCGSQLDNAKRMLSSDSRVVHSVKVADSEVYGSSVVGVNHCHPYYLGAWSYCDNGKNVSKNDVASDSRCECGILLCGMIFTDTAAGSLPSQ